MKRTAILALLLGSVFAVPSFAALKPGDAAPDFTAKVALGGEESTFKLTDALKKGPVVLYFFPKAFTTGCTAEVCSFRDGYGELTPAGVTVIIVVRLALVKVTVLTSVAPSARAPRSSASAHSNRAISASSSSRVIANCTRSIRPVGTGSSA